MGQVLVSMMLFVAIGLRGCASGDPLAFQGDPALTAFGIGGR
jgi:hypothetical protein